MLGAIDCEQVVMFSIVVTIVTTFDPFLPVKCAFSLLPVLSFACLFRSCYQSVVRSLN